MAGHSKWKNIQHRKNAQDAKRGKLFMKLAKDIFTAAKTGGGDPDTNNALRTAIEKAKAANMPNDNITRAINKATGNINGATYEEITYEGYGPGGTAVMVEVLTDNKNRSASEVRHAFSKHGGNLGESGCVAYMFDKKGVITVEAADNVDEEALMLDAIEAGAEEMENEDGVFIILTQPEDFTQVRETLESQGYRIEDAEVTMIPKTTTTLSEADKEKMMKLIDALEENDDVQDIYHNLNED
ncbi:YebC/PmpR family DNA-binding regulatory protein [Scopulibacillus daqui]|uniref:Probable transcriptional regulatory protein JOD45_000911 n=1 Tax=Scopulibacillus daqui TaxID=1469162 RepID=A0ABS2PZ33_9BACL|nr:YebC/PmpR family DNA-binding transcriptional regulator [Scopulibacillus daqui]MBM7644704.1 YebC/PmpR family DNA-binding regulatory protein [Scopulibacillus daqui]